LGAVWQPPSSAPPTPAMTAALMRVSFMCGPLD
jgi:hypothetical protein